MLLEPDDNRVLHDGQGAPDQSSPVTLAVLAEVMLASEEHWALLPPPYDLMGREFLDGVLVGAGCDG